MSSQNNNHIGFSHIRPSAKIYGMAEMASVTYRKPYYILHPDKLPNITTRTFFTYQTIYSYLKYQIVVFNREIPF